MLRACAAAPQSSSAGFSPCRWRYEAVASFMTWPGSFHLVEKASTSLTPCLQNPHRLSNMVAGLRIHGWLIPGRRAPGRTVRHH